MKHSAKFVRVLWCKKEGTFKVHTPGETTIGSERETEGMSDKYGRKRVILGNLTFPRNISLTAALTRFSTRDVKSPIKQSFLNDGKFVRFLRTAAMKS